MWKFAIDMLHNKTAICPPTIPDNIVEEPYVEVKERRDVSSWYGIIIDAINALGGSALKYQIADHIGYSRGTTNEVIEQMVRDEVLAFYEDKDARNIKTVKYYYVL